MGLGQDQLATPGSAVRLTSVARQDTDCATRPGTHVLMILLNKLGKRDKMRGLPSILSLFRNVFNKFNNAVRNEEKMGKMT